MHLMQQELQGEQSYLMERWRWGQENLSGSSLVEPGSNKCGCRRSLGKVCRHAEETKSELQ
jgi:hypothetical protein